MKNSLSCCLALAAFVLSNATHSCNAQVIASSVGPTIGDDVNVTSFSFTLPDGLSEVESARTVMFTAGTDVFGYQNRGGSAPANLLDNSVVSGTDTIGVLQSTDMDDVFAVIDSINGDNGTDAPLVAEWVFDVSTATSGLTLGIDMAAIGDFEAGDPVGPVQDFYQFEYSFDGVNFTTAFLSAVDEEAADVPYQLENAELAPVTFNDPLLIGTTQLDNDFQTLTTAVSGSGSELTLRFTGHSDGGSEVFAFRNITILQDDGSLLLGDYDDDGLVDGVDYAVWREAIADGVNELPNDATPGVSFADFAQWQDNFGASGSGAIATPEPSGALLLSLLTLPVYAFGRRFVRR